MKGRYMKFKKIFIVVILFFQVAFFINDSFADQLPIKNMIFFGDSLSDVGNNTWILMDGVVGTPIVNPDEQNRKYLWVNYLVEKKLGKFVYPSNQPNLSPVNDNIDYAYASADSSNHYLNTDWPQKKPADPSINPLCTQPGLIKDETGTVTSTCTPGLLIQVDDYLKAVQYKPSPNTVIFIWSGANDLLNYFTDYISHYVINKFSMPANSVLEDVAKQAVLNVNAAKQKLIDAGVSPENIYILNLPDLSRTPAIRDLSKTSAIDASTGWKSKLKIWVLKLYGIENIENSLSNLTQDFNTNLQLQTDAEKYHIPVSHYVQINTQLNKIIADPSQYKLTNIDESCVAKKEIPLCTGFLFYNKKHPTTYVNQLISDNVIDLLSSR